MNFKTTITISTLAVLAAIAVPVHAQGWEALERQRQQREQLDAMQRMADALQRMADAQRRYEMQQSTAEAIQRSEELLQRLNADPMDVFRDAPAPRPAYVPPPLPPMTIHHFPR